MKRKEIVLIVLCLLLSTSLFSQISLPVPYKFKNAVEKGTRTLSGEPGVNYWQNKASYILNIEFDPITGNLSGTEEITYYNNSPDTLKEIVFKIYPNIFKKGSPRQFHLEPEDIHDGIKISSFMINNETYSNDNLKEEGTIMKAYITPVKPKDSINITLTYSYKINENNSYRVRGGKIDETTWFIPYFLPRIAVYDDIDGWDVIPHTGFHEFYNDFCDFELNVTVPTNYMVWATGVLQNSSKVFTEKFLKRFKTAEKLEKPIFIIDKTDLSEGNITLQNKQNTFKFTSENIPDVAFAVSDHYVWQSSGFTVDEKSSNKARLDVVFNPNHNVYYEIFDFSKKSLEIIINDFPGIAYPYPKMIIFDGNSEMEFPMMINYRATSERNHDVSTILHEIAHTYFPFYTGLNEVKNSWIDEGLATYIHLQYTSKIDSLAIPNIWIEEYLSEDDIAYDLPIISYTHQQNWPTVFNNSYTKPALGLIFLKDLVGDENFVNGIKYFTDTWNGKHPTFSDFIFCMNKGFGSNQDWFWKAWFFESGIPDLAIKDYKKTNDQINISVEKVGRKPVPIELTIYYNDGTEEKFYKKADVWKTGNSITEIRISAVKKIVKVKLGNAIIPDLNLKNNIIEINQEIKLH